MEARDFVGAIYGFADFLGDQNNVIEAVASGTLAEFAKEYLSKFGAQDVEPRLGFAVSDTPPKVPDTRIKITLTDADKFAVRQWMVESLEGGAILECGDLPTLAELIEKAEFRAIEEAIMEYGEEIMREQGDSC